MITTVQNKRRGFPGPTGTIVLGLVAIAICLGRTYWRPSTPARTAIAASAGAAALDAGSNGLVRPAFGNAETSSAAMDESLAPTAEAHENKAAPDGPLGRETSRSAAAEDSAASSIETQAPAKLASNITSKRVPLAGALHAPVVVAAAPRPRARDEKGLVFSGQSDQIALVKAQMRELLKQMGWTANQVLVSDSAGGERIAYVLNSAPGDTNTFVLSQQPQLGIVPELIHYTSRHGQKKTLALVSQKEILATMLQSGRAFVFSGANCLVERLKEQIALRQNVVYWGLRADWVFPEDKVYRYNTADYWQVMQGDDWTVKPGIKASQAIADAFVGKFSYQIGCTSACRFIFAHGIFNFYHEVRPNSGVLARLDQLLDNQRPFIEIAPQVDRNRVVVKEGRLMERHVDVPWNNWVPGDWGWIKNPDDKSSEELGSEGCNIIYAGGGFFVNYYPERPPKTLDQAIKRVYGWRFGLEESELDLSADLMDELHRDPRWGGMLRDVRDYPKQFGVAGPAQPGA